MLFFVLLCTVIPSILAIGDWKATRIKHTEGTTLIERLLEECDAKNMPYSLYLSLGIPPNDYNLSDYKVINSRVGDKLEHIFRQYRGVSFSEKIKAVKLDHPELENEINYYVAVGIKEQYVYLDAVVNQLEDREFCVITNDCKITPTLGEILMYGQTKKHILWLIDDIGSETVESLHEKIAYYENSERLNLKYSTLEVHRRYDKWLNNCMEADGQLTTSSPDTYPVGTEETSN